MTVKQLNNKLLWVLGNEVNSCHLPNAQALGYIPSLILRIPGRGL